MTPTGQHHLFPCLCFWVSHFVLVRYMHHGLWKRLRKWRCDHGWLYGYVCENYFVEAGAFQGGNKITALNQATKNIIPIMLINSLPGRASMFLNIFNVVSAPSDATLLCITASESGTVFWCRRCLRQHCRADSLSQHVVKPESVMSTMNDDKESTSSSQCRSIIGGAGVCRRWFWTSAFENPENSHRFAHNTRSWLIDLSIEAEWSGMRC